ncbi:MAG TPA: DPP IV N-terminal domain-containing protein, partial [Longimicrobiales bacterium]
MGGRSNGWWGFIALTFLLTAESAPAQEARLLRFPHIHGDQVAFTYAGDLYTAPLSGGAATRLTGHEGLEVFARFSPDGRSIAFSGEYAGTRQVYVIPSGGGEPRQLTFYPDVGAMPPRGGYDHLVLDWTPNGESILVRANRTPFGDRVGRYYLVDPDGGLERPLEIPEGATGATFDATGNRLAFNIKSREWRHWKRYEGGRQQDVWTYDLAAHTSERLTDFTGTDNFPMWVGDRIYFVSDRDENRRLNLYAYETGTGEVRQVTFHEDFDVLWPSRGQGGIVYENGGWIWHFDPATEETARLSFTIPGDRPLTNPYFKGVSDDVESFDISPSGKRAVFGARGEVFTVPAEHGNIRNISNTPGQRERAVSWSPDGLSVAYLSDATGSYQLYVAPADGSGAPLRLTNVQDAWIDAFRWSPDSERIAYHDNRNRLAAVDVARGSEVEIDRTATGSLQPFSWSPDSEWIVYTRNAANGFSNVWLYSFATDEAAQVTSDDTNEGSPAFDPEGRFLYFTSARDFTYAGLTSRFNSRIYVATLRADVGHPFPHRSDEEPSVTPADESGDGGQASEDEALVIELDGLGERVMPLPGLSPGSYGGLVGLSDGLLYVQGGNLMKYDLDDRDSEQIMTLVQGFALTPDRSQM